MFNLKIEIEKKQKILLENKLYFIKLSNTLRSLPKSIEELNLELFNSVDEDFKSLENINILAEESESCNKDDVLEKLKRKELLESLESKFSEQKIDNLNKILSIEKRYKAIQESLSEKIKKSHPFKGYKGILSIRRNCHG